MSSKLRLKLGQLEVEFEGSEDFIKSDLKSFIFDLKPLIEMIPVAPPPAPPAPANPIANLLQNLAVAGGTMTTSMIAQKLAVSSGPELVVAAIAQLVLVQKKPSAARKDILTEMQTATTYYKDTYSSNLGAALKSLEKAGDINKVADNVFNLSATKAQSVAATIAK